MATRRSHDHEGLQVVSEFEGLNYVQHSDKQAVIPPQHALHNEKFSILGNSAQGANESRINGKTYCGLSKKLFVIIVAIISVIVIGAAVGGGVGGALSGKSSSTSTPGAGSFVTTQTSSSAGSIVTVTVTSTSSRGSAGTDTGSSVVASTSSSSASPSATGIGAYNCPAQNDTIYHPAVNPDLSYEIVCDVDQPDGFEGIDGNNLHDLNTGVVATSIESCIDACAGYTFKGDGNCNAVTYDVNITRSLSRQGITGNCFFKDQRAKNLLAAGGTGQVVSAYTV